MSKNKKEIYAQVRGEIYGSLGGSLWRSVRKQLWNDVRGPSPLRDNLGDNTIQNINAIAANVFEFSNTSNLTNDY